MTQLIYSGAFAFIVSVFLTPVLIRRFSAEGIGQEIREEGPKSHLRKRGTPTMGGIAIIAGILVGYFGSHLIGYLQTGVGPTASGLLVLFLTLSMGALGFADDFIKLYKGRNLGLNKTAKLLGQLAASLVFGVLLLQFPDASGITPGSTNLSFTRDITTWNLAPGPAWIGMIVFMVFVFIVIAAWSNAVNLTDGLDGLAAGAVALLLGTYTAIAFWQFRNSCDVAIVAGCYDVRDPLDIGILAAAGLGGCLGFLWWNAAPAKIFMGDTGSLALGGLIAGLSFVTKTELLMVIIGFIFVLEVASVAIQIAAFQTTGKRPFRMAPIHHHFEAKGWAETAVVVRFWLLAGIFNMLGSAIFYSDWLVQSGVLR
ncbi:phospho-N-acetylmuramoyl-pentapeptide-transferase [Corynebacterium freneyi]|uniref:phospho-N-acetylmuramoyl-pentapeptide- transferase n=1 Tax=Corynebacterium freneyi TaxID=134034 RepID=UPI002550C4CD|nr:phospho-N-acetylmuramoyl-pentapeptide-transferase [Corynebacterium freneyi]MDK8768406.1 phospho-N-acetylmuramoyl-pentapeptide-transferase [Corynebacterium freneyi]